MSIALPEGSAAFVCLATTLTSDPVTDIQQGRFQKEIKGSSFVGVAATPLKPLPSCYRGEAEDRLAIGF